MSDINIIDLNKIKSDRKQAKEMRKLDAHASYVCLEKCLNYLNMNKIEELNKIKEEIKRTMKVLGEIGKNG